MNLKFSSNNNKKEENCNNEFNCNDYNLNCNPCYRYCYVVGPTGPTGPSGGVLNYADFYALTITPLAGGTNSVLAHLVITQIA